MRRNGRSEAAAGLAGPGVGRWKGPGRWLILPLFWILVAGLAGGVAALGRPWLPYLVGGFLSLAFLSWVLLAALTPARADRRCPRCGEEKIEPLRKGDPVGIRCAGCGYLDPEGHVAHLIEE